MSDLVVVVDNAPCHRRLQEVFNGSGATLLHLGPYSPMLNPMEGIWSKIKATVKRNISVPQVAGANLQEQRLQFLETLIDTAKSTVTPGDCGRLAQHTTSYYPKVLQLEDVQPGY